MKEENIIKLEINNKTKHLEKYLRPQWSWKMYISIISLFSILTLIVIDLEINFIELFSDTYKYFGDIISRMLPPDFSNFKSSFIVLYRSFRVVLIPRVFQLD